MSIPNFFQNRSQLQMYPFNSSLKLMNIFFDYVFYTSGGCLVERIMEIVVNFLTGPVTLVK